MKWLRLTKVTFRVIQATDGSGRKTRIYETAGPFWVNLAKATSLDREAHHQPGGDFDYTVIAYCAYGSDSEPGSYAQQPFDWVLEHPDEIFHLAGVACAGVDHA